MENLFNSTKAKKVIKSIVIVVASLFVLTLIDVLAHKEYYSKSEQDQTVSTSAVSNDTDVIEQDEDSTEYVPTKTDLDNYFIEYLKSGTPDNYKELAESFGLYSNYKNTGTGSYYYKIALSYDDAKVISLSDIYKGDYCIVISEGGNKIEYCNNIDYIEIDKTEDLGIVLYDKKRMTLFDNGKTYLEFQNAEDALSYKGEIETELSPIEEFYEVAEIGMTEDEVRSLLKEYGLFMKYRRSNSKDGNITPFADHIGHSDYTTYIEFLIDGTLTRLSFYDYYVLNKYGLYVYYDSNTSAYYMAGPDTNEMFDTAKDAIEALHSYRLK